MWVDICMAKKSRPLRGGVLLMRYITQNVQRRLAFTALTRVSEPICPL